MQHATEPVERPGESQEALDRKKNAPESDMIFGDGVGASLVRGPYCQLDVGLCDVGVFLHWNSATEEGAWVGLKLTFKEAQDST